MTNAVNSISNHTVAGKLQEAQKGLEKTKSVKHGSVAKGAAIGATVGAGASGAYYYGWVNNIYKDEFRKISSEAIEKAAKSGSIGYVLETTSKISKESSKKAFEATKESFRSLGVTKGMFLKSIAATGLVFAAVGAGVGLIVKLGNYHKAKIAEQTAPLNTNAK